MFWKKKRFWDLMQNIAIFMLSLSAIFLFARTQFYNLGIDLSRNYFQKANQTHSNPSSFRQSELSAPLRIAVTGDYGRYSNIALTTDHDDFMPLGTLLNEALGSAQTFVPCDEKAFLSALGHPSVYYDFLHILPLSFFAELVHTSSQSPLSAQCLIVSAQDDTVLLYLWDGSKYYCSSTAVTFSTLQDTLLHFELGSASFAYDSELPHSEQLTPHSLLPDALPSLPTLNSSPPSISIDSLLADLHFNPLTNFRYTEAGGSEVITEGDRTLRLHPDGSLSYQGGGETTLSIDAADSIPTVQEAAVGVSLLLNTLINPMETNAAFYLKEIQQTDSETTLLFDYQLGGVPIYSDDSSAAKVVLSGISVSSLSLLIRQYQVSAEMSQLLPIRQALAIAADQGGCSLSVGYVDTGDPTVCAVWLTD